MTEFHQVIADLAGPTRQLRQTSPQAWADAGNGTDGR
jgi:hypothetical protein